MAWTKRTEPIGIGSPTVTVYGLLLALSSVQSTYVWTKRTEPS